jgi:hypothetical protein
MPGLLDGIAKFKKKAQPSTGSGVDVVAQQAAANAAEATANSTQAVTGVEAQEAQGIAKSIDQFRAGSQKPNDDNRQQERQTRRRERREQFRSQRRQRTGSRFNNNIARSFDR